MQLRVRTQAFGSRMGLSVRYRSKEEEGKGEGGGRRRRLEAAAAAVGPRRASLDLQRKVAEQGYGAETVASVWRLGHPPNRGLRHLYQLLLSARSVTRVPAGTCSYSASRRLTVSVGQDEVIDKEAGALH